MRRLRTMPATLALLGLMFPWARLVATSIHLADDHHTLAVSGPAAAHAATTLAEAFHGHHHDDGATPHGHPLVSCDFSAQRSRVVDRVAQPDALPAISKPTLPPRVPASPSRKIGIRDHGPPRAWSPAILRI